MNFVHSSTVLVLLLVQNVTFQSQHFLFKLCRQGDCLFNDEVE